MRLLGKRAIVTGSSSGIGRAIALSLAREGAKIVVTARGSGPTGIDAISEVVDEIHSAGGTAVGLSGPVNDPDFAEALVNHCVEQFGGIDILVNNAGVYTQEPAAACALAVWRETLDVNLNAAFYTSRFALPLMAKQRWGRVLNAASFSSSGLLGGAAYSASKSALNGFTRAIAADYGPYGITANVYNPEALTAMGASGDREVFKGLFTRWRDRGYLNEAEVAYRIGINGPDGVAPWITYLCLDEADYLNGEVFAVESRRVAVLPWPDEERVFFRDFDRHGPWRMEELQSMAPLVFPFRNRWPRRAEDDLEKWEKG
jgi:NAD(P)-dependent dehydrogenase (short-subunit alcohol dehydrogenase family)